MKFGDWLLAHGSILSDLTSVVRGILTEIPINPEHKAALNATLDKVSEYSGLVVGLAETVTEVVAPNSFTPPASNTNVTGPPVAGPSNAPVIPLASASFSW